MRVEPDDGPQPIIDLIRGARRSVALEIYLLTDGDVLAALVDARAAGRQVSVILEPHPFGADGANRAAYDRLGAAGAEVTWASARFALTHTKLLVVDGRQAAIMTSNLTHAGLNSNREYLAVDQRPADVAAAQAIIDADRADAPTRAVISGGRVIASPDTTRPALLSLLAAARQQIELEMEELSDLAAVDALIAAATSGVAVTAVVPASDRSSATDGALAQLVAGGVRVRALAAPVVHAKTIVIDRRRLYIGSINLTTASMDRNREVGLIADDRAAAERVSEVVAQDAAAGAPP
ncbi:MAG TPA: phospholipase D-like domain-containing protein [Polyangia bacterium]|nr:phospholipase D-like domain-containing protein [Polyangia bacterium]